MSTYDDRTWLLENALSSLTSAYDAVDVEVGQLRLGPGGNSQSIEELDEARDDIHDARSQLSYYLENCR